MKQACAWYPAPSPSSANPRSLRAWASQRWASAFGCLIDHPPLGEHLLDEGVALGLHLLQLGRRVHEEVETRPDVPEAREVAVAFEEWTSRVSDDHQVEVAGAVSLAPRDGSEHDGSAGALQMGTQPFREDVQVVEK